MSKEAAEKAHISRRRQAMNGFGALDEMYRDAYRQRRDSKSRKASFDLTEVEFVAVVAQSNDACMLSNIRFSAARYFKNGQVPCPFKPSLDRINASLGYTASNVQLISQVANFCKNEWSNDLVVMFCRGVAANSSLPFNELKPLDISNSPVD